MPTAEQKKRFQFEKILSEQMIYSVYQPIVSLEDGEILGYEGLSRILLEDCEFNTEEMFQYAEVQNKVWELEELCRIKTLRNASHKPEGRKLFINVDPKVMNDSKFINGITLKYLTMFGLVPEDIVFEITERTSIGDAEVFEKTVQHYKNQGYQIAIDDFGSGYAGLRRVCGFSSNYLKIDMDLVRNIDRDDTKRTLVESFVSFCRNVNIILIAEGIETLGELDVLIGLGVQYGQGYYLARPDKALVEISEMTRNYIKNKRKDSEKNYNTTTFFGNVGSICKQKFVTSPDTYGYELFEYIESSQLISEICVIDKDKHVLGLLSKTKFLEKFSGRFGYSLYARKMAKELVEKDCLIVDAMTSIERVSKMALAREINSMYDSVVVTQNDKYIGIVTVKDLLETAISIQVNRAVDANPLTKLPGNTVIQEIIESEIKSGNKFAFIYIDLDNFKAYNDTYGFANGDVMIKATAECIKECCMKEEFMGHIGGDDFVIVANYWDVSSLCNSIIDRFRFKINAMYNQEDLNNGYIISKNRNGIEEKFPIATLSIVVVTNEKKDYDSVEDFSKELAYLKKKCKHIKGNAIVSA